MIAFAAATIEESSDGEENALFALLMADLAEAEGAAAWEENERLKRDPEAVVPLEVQRHCLKPISRSCTDKTFRADPLNLLIETFADRTERSFFGGNSNRGSGEGRSMPRPNGFLRDMCCGTPVLTPAVRDTPMRGQRRKGLFLSPYLRGRGCRWDWTRKTPIRAL